MQKNAQQTNKKTQHERSIGHASDESKVVLLSESSLDEQQSAVFQVPADHSNHQWIGMYNLQEIKWKKTWFPVDFPKKTNPFINCSPEITNPFIH